MTATHLARSPERRAARAFAAGRRLGMAAALLAAIPAAARAQAAARSPAADGASAPRALRVCADPNNMPFSDRGGHGFENRIAGVLGRALHLPVRYTWWAQRRGFIRNTLGAHKCDVIIGIIARSEQVLTTTPYYRSTYVFVSRRAAPHAIHSFDDPALRRMRIGIHVIGDDYNSLPPGLALARRGLVRNVVGYSIYGDYTQESPPSRLITAVEHRAVDVAVAWGPLAGYYAARSPVPLDVEPVATRFAAPGIPFVYAIAAGVRRGDTALRDRLDRALAAHRREIDAILRAYHVPLLPTQTMRSADRDETRACTARGEVRCGEG